MEENEKRVWDMTLKDIGRTVLKWWFLIFLAALIVGVAVFVGSYVSEKVKKNYYSEAEYWLDYSVPKYNEGKWTGDMEIGDATNYIALYTTAYGDNKLFLQVERTLANLADEKLHYKYNQLISMFEIGTRSTNKVYISIVSPNPDHSKVLLETFINIANPGISADIEKLKNSDNSKSILNVVNTKMPEIGEIYNKNPRSTMSILLTAVLIAVVVAIVIGVVIVVITNFNGRFRRHDVFENNYGIPVYGDVTMHIYKEQR